MLLIKVLASLLQLDMHGMDEESQVSFSLHGKSSTRERGVGVH